MTASAKLEELKQKFMALHPQPAWAIKANGAEVANAIAFEHLKREWVGFQMGYALGLQAGEAQGREKAAKIVESFATDIHDENLGASDCARAIRDRGEQG